MDDSSVGRGLKKAIDWKLIALYLFLVFFGLVNIYASVHSSEPSSILDWSCRSGKQFVWIVTALVIGALILFVIPPKLWESLSVPLYVFVVVLLVAVIFLGVEVKGSRSWFEFGPVRFQPAEVSKISTSLLLALIMSHPSYKMKRPRDFIATAAIIILPMLIILAEKETGSALVYVGFIFMLYREGLSGWLLGLVGLVILLFILTLTSSPYAAILVLVGVVSFCNALNKGDIFKWLITWVPGIVLAAFLPKIFSSSPDGSFLQKINTVYLLVGIAVVALPFIFVRSYKNKDNFMALCAGAFVVGIALIFSADFIFNKVLQDHQRKRIEVLLGMKEDPSGVGYNVNQSMIAIGSGGFKGKGFLNGTQTTYGFVPEQSTDFIFCTVGEEWGFIGCFVVILAYTLLIWRLVYDAERCRESFTRIYGYCVASLLFMHLFINIGMTIGLMPVIGIPLPMMSYGGSSLWAFTILIFIFLALYREERKYF